jgi:parvulin-like peptidyl-prolyl isomerase
MKRICLFLFGGFVLFSSVIPSGHASEQKLPEIHGKEIVATVNNEPITLEEFSRSLAEIQHASMEAGAKAAAIDYRGILNRLIDEKLFLLEARNIGIDRLPEVTMSIDENAKKTLAKMLVRERLKEVKVDMDEVNRRFNEITREYKITAVVLEKEDDAKQMEEEIASGASFDDVVKKAVDGGKTVDYVEGKYLKERDLWPEVSGVLSSMEAGAVSPAVKFDKGFVIVRLEDVRYPDDPQVRERIINALAKDQREIALDEYTTSLIKKYVTIDKDLLENIDFDISIEEFHKLLKDTRILARVRGGNPVTVKEFSEAFQNKYYHGVEDKIKRKLLNAEKENVLEGLLQKRVLVLEAKKQGIDKTEEYRNRIEQFNKTIIFEQFMNKVVSPDIRLTEDELRKYYNEHPDSYTTPEMMRIDSVVFDTKEAAESAIHTLNTGTEFDWLKENAAGQVNNDAKGVLNFGGSVLSVKLLPEGAQKVLSGVRTGDFRLFADPDGYFYVLYAEKVYPQSVAPYQDVKNSILKDLYNRKVKESMKIWSEKLKEHYPVKIYMTEF